MTIYIDVVLIENLVINYIILYATGIILKIKVKHLRLILASLIGAIYSIISYVVEVKVYSNFMIFFCINFICNNKTTS